MLHRNRAARAWLRAAPLTARAAEPITSDTVPVTLVFEHAGIRPAGRKVGPIGGAFSGPGEPAP